MKSAVLREKKIDELKVQVSDWRAQLFKIQCQKAVGQMSDYSQFVKVRRLIARGETILREMEQRNG